MKIGIIGSGNIGGTLGKIWLAKDHEVMFGVRDKNNPKVKAIEAAGIGSVRVGSVAEAFTFGEAVLLAIPWRAVEDVFRNLKVNLKNKILIDCTNPIAPGLAGLALGYSTSAAEEIAKMAEGARIVKAFNTLGSGNLTDLTFGSVKADTFICGDDAGAKEIVKKLAEQTGFSVIDCGPLTQARLLEPLAMLWISLAYKYGYGPDIAIKLLRKA
jgi:NADPH-dependent F420 reductase